MEQSAPAAVSTISGSLTAPVLQPGDFDGAALTAWDATATVKMNGAKLERAFDLGFRIMKNKEIYKALNDSFTSNVIKINAKGNGLSLSQIVYILAELPAIWAPLEQGLSSLNAVPISTTQMHALLQPVLADAKVKASIAAHNDPS
ncbi:MAG: hypothetical protein V4760_19700, partial [Bdellovibrionota bacterium]